MEKKLNYFCTDRDGTSNRIDWSNISGIPDLITDAPLDGQIYGRGDGQWQNIEALRALSQFPPSFLTLDSNVCSKKVEVGTYLVEDPSVTDITFSYTAKNIVNLSTVALFLNGQNKTGNGFIPGDVFYYPLTEENNKKLSPHINEWALSGLNIIGEEIDPIIITHEWALRTFVGVSTRDDIINYNSIHFEIDGNQSVLERPVSMSKSPSTPAKYLYIFLPTGIDGDNSGYNTYTSFYLNQFETPIEKDTITIERFGIPVTYDIFRTVNPTSGAI